jgi:hypothetical protein
VTTPDPPPSSWYRSRDGRRYGREFAAIIVAKLVLLALLWAICIRPQPHADTAPEAVRAHLFAPPPSITPEAARGR